MTPAQGKHQFHVFTVVPVRYMCLQLEEGLGEHTRWSIGVKSILHTGQSKFQTYALVDSHPFGKVQLQPCPFVYMSFISNCSIMHDVLDTIACIPKVQGYDAQPLCVLQAAGASAGWHSTKRRG